jgi:Tol biopolymer transport system component
VLALLAGASAAYLAVHSRAPADSHQPAHAERLTLDPGVNIDPAISPDGKFVAYASDRSGEGNLDIWLKQIGGGAPIRLTRDPADDSEPSFSPDGTQIVFRSNRDGGGVYLVPALGGAERKIVDGGRRPRFSPDGKQVAYWKGSAYPYPLRAGSGESYIVDLETSQTHQIGTEFAATVQPVWSPDGKTMLVLGLKDPDLLRHTFDFWMVPLAGGPPVRCPVNSGDLAVPFAWLGDDVYFEKGVGEAGTGIRRLRIDRKTLQPVGPQEDLAVGTSDALTPSPAGDGRVVFAAVARKTNIWSLPLDANRGKVTGTPKAITNDLGENMVQSISNDGKRVAFMATQFSSGGGAQVWGADLETGQLHALTSEGQPKSAAEISPDGRKIAWRVALLTAEDIFTTPFGGGAAAKLCSDCTGRMAWSPDGRFALFGQSFPSRTMRLLELATGREIDYLNLKGTNLRPFPASFSPDGKWLAFRVDQSQSDYSVQVAPFGRKIPLLPASGSLS